MTDIQKRLFELQDTKYRDFQSALIPSVEKAAFIGVRTPQLKALAKEPAGTEAAVSFMSSLPHRYFDENQLHAFIICNERDFERCKRLVNDFLPFVDNWATCDQLSPKCFYKSAEGLLPDIALWLKSPHTYTARFGINALMRYFLDDRFDTAHANAVANVKCDEYYVKTAVAWYFATALAKQYEKTVLFIEENRLEAWTHNKAIQKAIESRRIPAERKEYLKSLKV